MQHIIKFLWPQCCLMNDDSVKSWYGDGVWLFLLLVQLKKIALYFNYVFNIHGW